MVGDEPTYVKDSSGYTLLLNVAYDFTGWATLSVRIQKPDGSVLTKSNPGDNVIPYNSDPTTKKVELPITADLTDATGPWKAVAVIDGMKSEPAGNYSVVDEFEN